MTTQPLEKDPRFKFGPPLIQTAEDAREAYLREQIDEKEFKEALGRFGVHGDHYRVAPSRLERGDEAFRRDLPDEYFTSPDYTILKVEDRIKLAEDKEKVREAATKASEKVEAKADAVAPLGELQNAEAEKAAEKPQEKLDKDTAKVYSDTQQGKK